MIKVDRIVNTVLNSNTYMVYRESDDVVWVVDPGDEAPMIDWINKHSKRVNGILVTHSHFDHIYGINELIGRFPDLTVYASFFACEGMLSERLNGSLYHERPYVVNLKKSEIVKEGDHIPLWPGIDAVVYDTPGHSRDSISFFIGNNLFTGDALIPAHKVVTKTKFGDVELAAQSLSRIFYEFDPATCIWPGHEEECVLSALYAENTFVRYK